MKHTPPPTITVIALLDKADPPEHSFVDGFLASRLPAARDVRVRLLVSRSELTASDGPYRYGRAVCLPLLYRRRGVGRFANFAVAIGLLLTQILRLRRRGESVVLFVRNCPILLCSAVAVGPLVDRVVYQSSFPHERVSGSRAMQWGARWLLRACRRGVQGVLAVSPLGLDRVQRLFPAADAAAAIPLLADVPHGFVNQATQPTESIRFVYIGSHAPGRGLSLVIGAAAAALDRGLAAEFIFLGCTEPNKERITIQPAVRHWIAKERLVLKPPISRSRIWDELATCHVGLSLIPPCPAYREAFPTKLAEYMSVGLAVLASRGIPAQERVIEASAAGVLVEWNVEAIANAMERFANDRAGMGRMQQAAREYTARELTPQRYLQPLRRILMGPLAAEMAQRRRDDSAVIPGDHAACHGRYDDDR